MYQLNTDLFFLIYGLSHHNPVLDWLMIFSAEALIFIMYSLAFFWALRRNSPDKKALILTFFSLLIAAILSKVLRLFLIEQRPFVTYEIEPLVTLVTQKSFPSLHTTTAAVLAWSYLFCRSSKILPLMIMAILVGFGRIFVGVHYPFDVIGGFLMGLLAVFIAWKIRSLFLTGPTTWRLK